MKQSFRAVMLGVGIAILLAFGAWHVAPADRLRDHEAYFVALTSIRDGGSAYAPLPPVGPHSPLAHYYLYPPHLASLLSVLPLSWVAFSRAWQVLTLLSLLAAAALMVRAALGRWSLGASVAVACAMILVPTVALALNWGQADVLVWALVAMAVAEPGLSGAGYAGAALLKVLGVWSVVAAAMRKDWRTVRQALAVVGGVTLLAAVVVGPGRFASDSWTWFSRVLPSLSQGQVTGWTEGRVLGLNGNVSLTAALLGPIGSDPLSAGPRVYLLLASIAGPLTVAWLGRRWPVRAHYLAVYGAAMLCSPICRPSYLVALLPALALLWRARITADVPTPATAMEPPCRSPVDPSLAR